MIKKEKSILENDDIKWYLCSGVLWISKHRDYEEIDQNIDHIIGSFNWIYPINDTLLFQKESGKLETVVIDFTSEIYTQEAVHPFIHKEEMIRGDLYLQEMRYQDFKFQEEIYYNERKDILYTMPCTLNENTAFVLLIMDDFGFVIEGDELKGWLLRNASSYIHIKGMEKKYSSEGCFLLNRYLEELNLWEETEDTASLKELLSVVNGRSDTVSLSIKECIESILSWEH